MQVCIRGLLCTSTSTLQGCCACCSIHGEDIWPPQSQHPCLQCASIVWDCKCDHFCFVSARCPCLALLPAQSSRLSAPVILPVLGGLGHDEGCPVRRFLAYPSLILQAQIVRELHFRSLKGSFLGRPCGCWRTCLRQHCQPLLRHPAGGLTAGRLSSCQGISMAAGCRITARFQQEHHFGSV